MPYVLGVDGGGSRTIAVVADISGKVLGTAVSGPSNIHATLRNEAAQALERCVSAALAEARVRPDQVEAAVFGLAGSGRTEDKEIYGMMLAELRLGCNPLVVPDVEIALDAATRGGAGVMLISGTGSVCFGRDAEGRTLRAGGYGPVLGDEGSGYQIGVRALSACLKALDGRGAPTALQDLLVQATGAASVDAIPTLLREKLDRPAIAALTREVFIAAFEHGDAVAYSIVSDAAQELASLAAAVLSRMEQSVPVFLSGGVHDLSKNFRQLVASRIRLLFPDTSVEPLELPPVAGAVWRAAALLGVDLEDLSSLTLPRGGKSGLASCDGPASRAAGAMSPPSWPVTETRNPRSENLSRMSAREIASLMNSEDYAAATAVSACIPEISRAIEMAAASIRKGGRLIYVGAGTSGRLGVLDASECPPTFGVPRGQVLAVIAGGRDAVFEAIEGAEDDAASGSQAMDDLGVGPDDTVVGIAASGSTPFTLSAVRRARERGARTVALVSNPGSLLEQAAELTVCPVVGPEVLTGSTRLKCATSHKMVLNMISTGAMVLAGKVFKNLMVDMQPTNEKLRRRAIRIVQMAAPVGEEGARRALAASGTSVKAAVTMVLAGVDIDAARDALAKAEGHVDKALEYLKGSRA